MSPINPQALVACAELPEHRRVLAATLEFFQRTPGISGGWVSGSVARGDMDEYSDLDVGFLCESGEARENIWRQRREWKIASWFHRFDADHIKPWFVIYLFEPAIKTDINLYVATDLPPPAGAPYTVAWDSTKTLANWSESVNQAALLPREIDWNEAIHDDERIWAWLVYHALHFRRGEYYECASFIPPLRDIVERWHARLQGDGAFSTRRVETRYNGDFIARLMPQFAAPSYDSIKAALRSIRDVHRIQRDIIAQRHGIQWATSPAAVEKISAMIEEL